MDTINSYRQGFRRHVYGGPNISLSIVFSIGILAKHSSHSEVSDLPTDFSIADYHAKNVVGLEVSVDNWRMLCMKVLKRIRHVADEPPDVVLFIVMVLRKRYS